MQVEYWVEEMDLFGACCAVVRAQNARFKCARALSDHDIDAMTPDRLVKICNRLRDALEQP